MRLPWLFLLLLLTLANAVVAQQKTIPPGMEFLYENDYDQVIKKFEREHIPLDGASVQYIFNNVLVFAAGGPGSEHYMYTGYDVNERIVFSVPHPGW